VSIELIAMATFDSAGEDSKKELKVLDARRGRPVKLFVFKNEI